MFSKYIFSHTASEIFNVQKNNRFSLYIFYGSKTVYKIIKSEEQRCIKFAAVLNQSDLIILFAEVFVRIFCHHFYLVSLDFLFLPAHTAKGISKREQLFNAFVSSFKDFLKQLGSPFILGHLRKFFQLMIRINNHYIDYCNKKFGK